MRRWRRKVELRVDGGGLHSRTTANLVPGQKLLSFHKHRARARRACNREYIMTFEAVGTAALMRHAAESTVNSEARVQLCFRFLSVLYHPTKCDAVHEEPARPRLESFAQPNDAQLRRFEITSAHMM